MASLVWTAVYLLLLVELAIVFILVIPMPRRWHHSLVARPIRHFRLGERLAKPVLFLGIALAVALAESFLHHQRIVQRLAMDQQQMNGNNIEPHREHLHHVHDKERKYKAERNMYLAGFALTLIFVIGRITQLMQESVASWEAQQLQERRQKEENEETSQKQSDKKND